MVKKYSPAVGGDFVIGKYLRYKLEFFTQSDSNSIIKSIIPFLQNHKSQIFHTNAFLLLMVLVLCYEHL